MFFIVINPRTTKIFLYLEKPSLSIDRWDIITFGLWYRIDGLVKLLNNLAVDEIF